MLVLSAMHDFRTLFTFVVLLAGSLSAQARYTEVRSIQLISTSTYSLQTSCTEPPILLGHFLQLCT